MWKLMSMDEKLDEILSHVSEEEDDEEEPD